MNVMTDTTTIQVTRDTHERLSWYISLTSGISSFDEMINSIMDNAGMGNIEVIRKTKKEFGEEPLIGTTHTKQIAESG